MTQEPDNNSDQGHPGGQGRKQGRPDRALVARRLLESRLSMGLSRTQVSARANIADNSIYRYETGRNLPRPEIMTTLARVYGRTVEWLRGMDNPTAPSQWDLPSGPSNGGTPDIDLVPVIATVAGSGAFSLDETVRYWHPFRQDFLKPNGVRAQDCRLVEVREDSMAPTIPLGAFVLVDTGRNELWDGRAYLMTDANEGVVVRRVFRAGTSWIVTADKPGSRPLVWDEEWTVHGLVWWTLGVCA